MLAGSPERCSLIRRSAERRREPTETGMLTGLFLTLIIVALLLHFFFVERPRRKGRLVDPSLPEPLPLAEALEGLADKVLFQPNTLTWIDVLPEGHLLLGLHPVLISLVGSPYRLDVMAEGWHVGKGKPLLRVQQGRRDLQVYSPVAGRIAEVNPNACMERGWTQPRNADECWIYRIEPENLIWEVPSWLEAREGEEWLRTRLADILSFLSENGAAALPEDPGEIPVGILQRLDETAWNAFQDRFLTPEGATRDRKRPAMLPFGRPRPR
jgi:glycine cleavage system H lipoate-binding protein